MESRTLKPSMAALAIAAALMFLGFQQAKGNEHVSTDESLRKSSFPRGFAFGAATSAYQIEGAAREGGRGPSIWDTFSHTVGKIADGSNGDVAADSYHRYREDVQLLKAMGMDSYRFSISWSRLLPKGTISGGINEEGIKYYHDLIDECLKNGIKPFVTLFHWDLPQALEDKYNGFLGQQIIKDFAEYADLCFKNYGDKVKHWITLNEPLSYAEGYDHGAVPPARCSKYIGNCTKGNSATEPYIASHNLILSHAAAVQVYRNKYQKSQKGSIGITINTGWMMPYSSSLPDRRAALRAMDFMFGWYMGPIIKGDYPTVMRKIVRSRLPEFSNEQKKMVNGSFDFIGLNYYTSRYASHLLKRTNPARRDFDTDSLANITTEKNGIPIGPKAASSWLYIYPQGLRDLLIYTKKVYRNPPVYVTENGVDEENNKGLPLKAALEDTTRINYYLEHLQAVREAINAGVDVRGYFAWSLMDNFEWANGYTVRFGLYYVDFNNGTLNRYPKASVQWFKNFLLE